MLLINFVKKEISKPPWLLISYSCYFFRYVIYKDADWDVVKGVLALKGFKKKKGDIAVAICELPEEKT